jgi:transmembrane sensor
MNERGEGRTLDDATVARLWGGIESRRRSRARTRSALTVAAGGALALALWTTAGMHPTELAATHPERVPALAPALVAGPVHLASGGAVDRLEAAAASRHVALDDGSTIDLARGAHLEVRANTASAFTGRLDGTATFDVRPGGPRRWSVVTDLVTVDVLGTRFVVEETETAGRKGARVSVDHGVVLVRGDAVPGHFQRLVDGQSLRVTVPVAEPEHATATVPAAAARRAGSVREDAGASDRERPWRALARKGDFDAAYEQLGAGGIAREAEGASVDDLLLLADVARLSRHGRDAVNVLSHVVDGHPSDARAPVAAFTLGRLELDTLEEPRPAATAFARALALGLPGGLVEDAYARLVEAHARAGDLEAARGVASDYERRYPGGSRSPTMRRWVSGAVAPPPGP